MSSKSAKRVPLGAMAKGADGKERSIEEVYQKKSQLEHILLRPDTYIGSTEAHTQTLWVMDEDPAGKLFFNQRPITYVPGLFKIFDEILVNAYDNKQRDESMNKIRVDIDAENGKISVWNNGAGIPVEIHKEQNMYVPEMIFGHLLTSSNYDDATRKVTGGRNGYGAKLTNIFSTKFIVETADADRGKLFKQTFRNNMHNREEPKISDADIEEDYTQITFCPDFSKFAMDGFDTDIIALLRKRVYDMAGCSNGNLSVYLNGKRVPVRSFKNYVNLYFPESEEAPTLLYEKPNSRWEVCVTPSDGTFNQVSFVNGICTTKGGTHIAHATEAIVNAVLKEVSKKNKAAPVKPAHIKNHLFIFVNCLIENPAFDSQTKETMTTRSSSFGSKCELSDKFVKSVLKSGVVERVMDWAKYKQNTMLKKHNGKKTTRLANIPKLDDANWAGTKNSKKCTLILTEGDSAKALAVAGIGVVGRDCYGVYPLRGKLLNVREATHKQLMENKEINELKQILGLQVGKKYENTDSLRYGHLMVMTDQDHDGSHIKGLIINFLDHFWPSLLKMPGFLQEFVTPIVKVSKGPRVQAFFTLREYNMWKEENTQGKGWQIKYYKGLGTSSAKEAREYFSDLGLHQLDFRWGSEEAAELIDMAFNKKKADRRKSWLSRFVEENIIDHSQTHIRVEDFINKELIHFSMADNVRSIPSMMDGLKPGQRKILFACFKRKLKADIKVAQLSGYVAEHAAYHHGEQSLQSTIVTMAQNFVGSNNLNLLMPQGQFGTRLQGGKDSASARYIFTTLSPLARLVFNCHDDFLLNYLQDDGQMIEPSHYVPVVPLVLINGAEGIGTGWSTSVPTYNPRDIVSNLKCLLSGRELQEMSPWFRHFTGTVEPIPGKPSFLITGNITRLGDDTVEITELPVGRWTQDYKEFLETMLAGTPQDKEDKKVVKGAGTLAEYTQHHTDTAVHFKVKLVSKEALDEAEAEGLLKRFKLTTTVSTSNMHLFDKNGEIKKYTSPVDILKEFYDTRIEFYDKRKAHLVDDLKKDHERLSNKARFIEMVISSELVVSNRKKSAIYEDLEFFKFAKLSKNAVKTATPAKEESEGSDHEDGDGPADKNGSYDYLLSMPIWSLTRERVDDIKRQLAEKEAELEELSKTSIEQMYERDLDEFLEMYNVHEEQLAAEIAKSGKVTAKAKKLPSKPKSKTKIVKRLSDSEDSDDPMSEGDSDFAPIVAPKPSKVAPKTTAPKATAPKPAAAKPAAAKPAVKKAGVQKQKITDFMSTTSAKTAATKPKKTIDVSEEESLGLSSGASDSESDFAPLSARVNSKAAPKPRARAPVADISEGDLSDSPKKPAPKKRAAAAKPKAKATTVLSEESDGSLGLSDGDSEFEPLSARMSKKASVSPARNLKRKLDSPGVSLPQGGNSKKLALEDPFEFEDTTKPKAVVRKAPAKKTVKNADFSDSETHSVEEVTKPKRAAKRAPAKKAPVKDFSDSEADSVEEVTKPKPAAKRAPAKKAPVKDLSDSDADSVEEVPKPKPAAKRAPAKKAPVKKAPPAKKPPAKRAPTKKAPVSDEEMEELSDISEPEAIAPPRARAKRGAVQGKKYTVIGSSDESGEEESDFNAGSDSDSDFAM